MKKIEVIILTFVVLSFSLIPLLWFSGSQMLLGYDNVYPLNPVAFLTDRFYSWSVTQGFGFDQSAVQGSLLVHFIDSIPQLVGYPPYVSEKLVLIFWFFLLLFAPYLLITRLEKYDLIKTKYIRYIFPILYAFNFYILQAWWVAERTKFSLIVVTPLIFSIILPMTTQILSVKKVIRNSILCAVLLTIFNGGSWGGLSLYGGLIVALICFFCFYSYVFFISNRKKNIGYLVLFFLSFIFTYLLLNAYALLPFISTILIQYNSLVGEVGGISGIVAWTRYLSENTSFINLFRFQGIPDWYNNIETHPYASVYLSNLGFMLSSFIFPVLLFVSFLVREKENKNVRYFFLFLLLISLFLSAGIHKPFGFVFEFLMIHVPGFVVFRSPIFKFGYAYWFAGSFLIGVALSMLVEYLVVKTQKYGIHALSGVFFSIIIILGIVFYHSPYLTGNIFNIEKTSISSRVKVPSYVYDFSKWWAGREENNRILLLPKLNENWYFDQYKWNYMSLFPVLGNFGNRNTVTNSIILTSDEQVILNELYASISKRDYEKMDSLTSALGVQYFLIRNDFYYNLPDQETENPADLELKLQNNPNIEKAATFGKWIVYKYKKEKPLFLVKNSAILSGGSNLFQSSEIKNNSLILDISSYKTNPKMFSDIVIHPDCLSCLAEKQAVSVIFPRPSILPDSTLYEFIKVKKFFQNQRAKSISERTFQYVGETLKYAVRINELIKQDKNEKYVNLVKSDYINTLNLLNNDVPNIISQSPNPYNTSIIVQQYLDEETDYIHEILTRVNRESLVVSLESIIYAISKIKDSLGNFYSEKDYNSKKMYRFNVPSEGEYELKIPIDSVGLLVSNNPVDIKISIDNEVPTSATSIEKGTINFTKQNLKNGDHNLTLFLPKQSNILPSPIVENIAGRVCYSSIANNFSSESTYRLNFITSNNFDPNYYFFVDNAETFFPSLAAYFPITGNQEKKYSYVVSSSIMPLRKGVNTLRVAFCSTNLNQKIYSENVKQLSFTELTTPSVILHKAEGNSFSDSPVITYQKINQTKYVLEIKHAKNPFFLVFSQRFSLGWHLSKGDHVLGNIFANAWYLKKEGDYVLSLEYKPQKYGYIGLAVSVATLFCISLYFLITKRK